MQRHKAKSPFPIRELTTDDLPQVAAHYKLESKEEIAATIEHGLMFGAEVDGETPASSECTPTAASESRSI